MLAIKKRGTVFSSPIKSDTFAILVCKHVEEVVAIVSCCVRLGVGAFQLVVIVCGAFLRGSVNLLAELI